MPSWWPLFPLIAVVGVCGLEFRIFAVSTPKPSARPGTGQDDLGFHQHPHPNGGAAPWYMSSPV